MLWCQEDELTSSQKRRTIILCIDQDSDSDVVIEEEEGNFEEKYIITQGNE